jgi:transcription elongation factor Elf1
MMEISSHPSVDELREALRERDVTFACTVCGRKEFSRRRPRYGAPGWDRTTGLTAWCAQLVCEECGHVMGFEIEKLQKNRS